MTDTKAKPRNLNTKVEKARLVVRPVVEAGLTIDPEKLSKQSGFSEPTIERAYDWERARWEALQEAAATAPPPVPTPVPEPIPEPVPVPLAPAVTATLPPATQEKLAALEARLTKRLELAFEDRIQAELKKRIEENVLPYYKDKLAKAELLMKSGKPFTNQEYISLLRAFHPDSSSPEYRTAAFRLIKEKEPLLRPEEKDKPLTSRLPKTWAEVMAMQQKREPRTRAKGSRKNASETV